MSSAVKQSNNKVAAFDLQRQHPLSSPSSVLRSLANVCEDNHIDSFDVYGDFHIDDKESFLRKFEADVAKTFGKEDAVFMPSGTMAQSIALLIHVKRQQRHSPNDNEVSTHNYDQDDHTRQYRHKFACHPSCHLLLHEQDAYKELIGMDAIPVTSSSSDDSLHISPLKYEDVEVALKNEYETSSSSLKSIITCLILELPHRELGGKLTPWNDVKKIRQLCDKEGIKFHCDGARIFEASAGYGLSLPELAQPFDSVYISFYKGLGGITGAMLMGDESFCAEARVWLTRHGGNLYTLLPYAVSALAGFKRHIQHMEPNMMTFEDKKDKIIRVVASLSSDTEIKQIVSFDPQIPSVNMVHGYFKHSLDECNLAIKRVKEETGITVLSRMVEVSPDNPAYRLGYKVKFELTMGSMNGGIEDEIFLLGWKQFASILLTSKK